MVLNKSKWDHKAKVQYLKKHNLARPKATPEQTPKWSGKKTQRQQPVWESDDDAEWDDEDDLLLEHFYPQISDDNLLVDQKRQLKRQIIHTIRKREETPQEAPPAPHRHDGIYLGTPEGPTEAHGAPEPSDELELDIPDLDAKLQDFLVAGRPKNRKLLSSNLLEDLLAEYGIDSYASTVRDTDYNALKKTVLDLDKLSASALHGLRIGEPHKAPENRGLRSLTETEVREHDEREQKLQHARLLQQIKTTFGEERTRGKVLEINNINANDDAQMKALNAKLAATGDAQAVDDTDLDEILGLKADEPVASGPGFLAPGSDPLAEILDGEPALLNVEKKSKEPPKRVLGSQKVTDQFLDDLLGI